MKIFWLLLLLSSCQVFGQNLSVSDQLIHNTIKLSCSYYYRDSLGIVHDTKGSGTAFIFSFKIDTSTYPIIITNKHVIENAYAGTFFLTKSDSLGNPNYGDKHQIDIPSFGDLWIPHPNPNIDLCFMFFGNIINGLEKEGTDIFYRTFTEEDLPSDEEWDSFQALEEVLMVGYPNGLWDSKNNTPVMRRGITGTPLRLDYEGKKEFLVDIAAIPGSSGSPIILLNEGAYKVKNSLNIGGTRLRLLGILYAGPFRSAIGKGEIVFDKVPVNFKTETRVMINIGTIIKSSVILDFKKIILEMTKK